MAYTDPSLSSSIKIKQVHISELGTAIVAVAQNAKKSSLVDISALTYTKIAGANITLLRRAVNALEESFSGNCCQADCCQTCQTTKCQSSKCQSCQTCQSTTCQSSKCQSCQRCQTCQKCQTQCWSNCSSSNCDCGDDTF